MASGLKVADAQSRTSGNCWSGKTLALGATQEGNVSSILVWRYSFATLSCFFALIGMPPANVDGTTQQDARQKASPEMDRLKKLYLGWWDYTETYSKTPFYRQGGSDTGVYTSEPGPGGNSIVNRFHSQGAVGDFEGLLVITWDSREKAYKSYVFGNEFPGCIVQTGQFEGDRLVFGSDFAAEGVKIKLRNVTRVSAVGKSSAKNTWLRKDRLKC
jgi:hypothetical protein